MNNSIIIKNLMVLILDYSAISALIWIPLALKTLGPEKYAKSVSISVFYANGIISIILLGNQSTALKYSAEFWENYFGFNWQIEKPILSLRNLNHPALSNTNINF
jgi:hypothetical protein